MRKFNVILSGVVASDVEFSHSYEGQSFYTFSLAVRREQESEDVLIIMAPDSVSGLSELSAGDRICVKGYLNTRRSMENGVYRSQIYVNCYELDAASSDDKDTNSVSLVGTLRRNNGQIITDGRNRTEFTVESPRYGSKSDYIRCVAWNGASDIAKDIPEGARVFIHGRMKSRTLEDGRMSYEVSVRHISRVPDAGSADAE